MTDQAPASASAEVTVDADADTVYRLITDLPTLASFAEEAHAMEWRKGDTAEPGAVFRGHNRSGSRTWTTTCTVTAAEPGRTFAFDVRSAMIPVAHWRYDIVSTGDATCRVTESTWDRRPGWFRIPAGWATGVKDRDAANTEHITLTLQRLKQRAEAG
ncbi:SRPBCC family protein [Mycolicibacterium sp. XJ1819]